MSAKKEEIKEDYQLGWAVLAVSRLLDGIFNYGVKILPTYPVT
jgi:hypothetical protein